MPAGEEHLIASTNLSRVLGCTSPARGLSEKQVAKGCTLPFDHSGAFGQFQQEGLCERLLCFWVWCFACILVWRRPTNGRLSRPRRCNHRPPNCFALPLLSTCGVLLWTGLSTVGVVVLVPAWALPANVLSLLCVGMALRAYVRYVDSCRQRGQVCFCFDRQSQQLLLNNMWRNRCFTKMQSTERQKQGVQCPTPARSTISEVLLRLLLMLLLLPYTLCDAARMSNMQIKPKRSAKSILPVLVIFDQERASCKS